MRDPLSLVFGVGFPVVILLLITLMKKSIPQMPETTFPLTTFVPGMAIFGLSFISLFLGQLIGSDRDTSFLMRVFASPMRSSDYILGYTVPMIPVAVIQGVLVFGVALIVGLTPTWNILAAVAVLAPISLLFIGMGLLMGATLTAKQAPGIGSVIVNVVAWLSGTWFDLDMMGGVFRKVCYALPFAHTLDLVEGALKGDWTGAWLHIAVVLAYTLVFFVAAIILFRRRMKGK